MKIHIYFVDLSEKLQHSTMPVKTKCLNSKNYHYYFYYYHYYDDVSLEKGGVHPQPFKVKE